MKKIIVIILFISIVISVFVYYKSHMIPVSQKIQPNEQANVSTPNDNTKDKITPQSPVEPRVSKYSKTFIDPITKKEYPNIQYKALATPNDPLLSNQWYLNKISASVGWDISTGLNSSKIAIIDTGFGLSHEDLTDKWSTNTGEQGITNQEGGAPNCTSRALTLDKYCNNIDDDGNGLKDDWRGWDFDSNDNSVQTGEISPSGQAVSHGTLTSGLAAASTNNNKGIAGMNWGAKILPIQALDDDGYGYTSSVGMALRYAVDQGVNVISLSLGATEPDEYLKQQIDYATANGVIVVAAAGNDGSIPGNNGCECILYPANYPEVIAVGGTTSADTRASFSSFGSNLDIVAPGSSITTTSWSQASQSTAYSNSVNGTSFSAPIVAGAVANIRSHNLSATTETVVQALLQGADKVSAMNGQNRTNEYGYGRLNLYRSLQLVGAPTNTWPTIMNYICSSGVIPPSANSIYFQKINGRDYANLLVYSPTSTNCIESHIWNTGMQSWRDHIATNQSVLSYPDVQAVFGDLDGSASDHPVLFGVINTSTNKIEAHVWNKNMRSYLAHAASNQATIDPADCKIIIADLDGNQKEDPTLICLRNTSTGKIELHTWNPGMQSWRDHIITNMPAVDPSVNTVVAGDIDGNGADELILVAYNTTGSGKVEFHVWNSGQQTWWYHIATNLDPVDSSKGKIEFADTDGNRVDEPIFVKFKETGSSKIEFHIWNPGYYSWRYNIASNQATL